MLSRSGASRQEGIHMVSGRSTAQVCALMALMVLLAGGLSASACSEASAAAPAVDSALPGAQSARTFRGCGRIKLNGYTYRASARGLSCRRARIYLRRAANGRVPRGYICAASAYVCWTGRSYERSRHVFRALTGNQR